MLEHEPHVPQTEWILSHVPNGGKPFSIAETFKLNVAREAFRARVAAHWNATRSRTTTGRPVDAILSPVAATLAPPHDTTRWWGYTSYWNLVDYPAAVFPVGKLSQRDYTLLSDVRGRAAARNEVEAFVASQWDPATYDNAPVSLQLIGRRLHEEHVLGVLTQIDNVVNAK